MGWEVNIKEIQTKTIGLLKKFKGCGKSEEEPRKKGQKKMQKSQVEKKSGNPKKNRISTRIVIPSLKTLKIFH